MVHYYTDLLIDLQNDQEQDTEMKTKNISEKNMKKLQCFL